MNGARGTDTYISPRVKQIASGKLLYSREFSQCCALSMETRSPREVADERRMASSLLLEGSQEDRPNCQATVLARWETGGTGELDYL